MYNRAHIQSVVRVGCGLGLWVGTAMFSCGQSPLGQQHSGHSQPVNLARSYGGWTRSQPTSAHATRPEGRASYYQQFGDALPSFPDALPRQPIGLENESGSALMNSLSDLPANSFAPQALPGSYPEPQLPVRQGNDFSIRQSDSLQGQQFPQQINTQYENSFRDNVASQPERTRVPVTQAAYQSGTNPVLPPQQQYQLQPQYQPDVVGGSAQLRSQEFATGLPHVTPPPRKNPYGNFPTSPYMGRPMYMNASYQRSTTANYPNQAPSNVGSTLPQNIMPNQQPVFTNTSSQGVYPAGYPQQCAPTLPPDGAVGAYVPPTVTPNWNPNMYSPNNSGYRPFLSLGQENYNVVLGRGILGQPTAYVPGQYIRNFLRYIFP